MKSKTPFSSLNRMFILLICVAFTFTGCKKPEPVPIAVQSVSLDKSTLTLMVGQDETLTATVLPADAENKAVAWSAAPDGFIKIEKVDDTKAKVTALAAPSQPVTVTVTTNDGGKTGTCSVTVNPIPTYGISLDITDSHIFDEVIEGYDPQTPKTVTVTNTSNQPTGALTVALSGTSADSFNVEPTSLTSITEGGTATFTVVPKDDLTAGSYSSTVTVSGSNDISAGFTVSLEVAKYAITLSQTEDYTFPEASVGYSDQTPKEVTITNDGNRATGELSITLSGDNADSFEVDPTAITDIAVEGDDSFTIVPKTGLAGGTYTATVIVSGENDVLKSFDVSFIVNSYAITLSQTEDHTFTPAEKGYVAQTPLTVTVTNTGNNPTGDLTVTLSGDDADSFEVDPTAITDIVVEGTATFTVVPKIGLVGDTYTATVTVSGDNSISESFDVSFVVTALPLWTDGVTANAATTFSGGDGSEATPYLISSTADLVQLAVNVNTRANVYSGKYFELISDLDLAGKSWIPIGLGTSTSYAFQGRFDGKGHIVRNMIVDDRDFPLAANYNGWSMCGLFGWTYDAYIKNIGLENGSMYITRNKFGNAGLLVGYGDRIKQFENCWATGIITVASGTYSSDSYLGGLTGQTYSNASPLNCYFIGKIICDANTSNLCGLLGNNRAANSVNCYAVAEIETTDVSGVYAFSNTNSSNCYFNSDVCSKTDGSNATGKTTVEMKSAAMAALLNNGGTLWTQDPTKNNGYPYLVAVPPGN